MPERAIKIPMYSSYEPGAHLPLDEIRKLDEKYILNTYARVPFSFQYGSGEFLYDAQGKEYIDFLSGIAVTSVGHTHADLVNVLLQQGETLWHSSNIFYNQQQAMLARALVELTFESKVFFCNSGTEANEAAIKALKMWGEKNGKKKILGLENSFHGRTIGSISVTGQNKARSGFGDLLPNIEFIKANDMDSLRAIDDDTCGIILEPILGEGGALPLEPKFLRRVRELCTSHKAILVLDEIQTGIGRTGTYFYYQQCDIRPDILTMAKGLGGGFPIGALIVSKEFTNMFDVGVHGSTFGGNHLACAVAYETLRIIEANHLLENVKSVSQTLWTGLEKLKDIYPDKVKSIQGKGFMIGVVLSDNISSRQLIPVALEKGLVIGRSGKNVMRLLPPLILRKTTALKALEKLEATIKEI